MWFFIKFYSLIEFDLFNLWVQGGLIVDLGFLILYFMLRKEIGL